MNRAASYILALALGGVGCTVDMKTTQDWSDSGLADDTGMDGDGDTGEADDGEEPVWWELGASISIAGGLIDPNLSTLSVRMLSANVEPLCDESVALLAASDEPALPDEEILAWWRIAPAELSEDCSGYPQGLPSELLLGVGALQADVRAVLGPAGLDSVADGLNGAFVSLDDGETVYTFGVAGTDQAYAGESAAATEAPLADGTWTVISLFAFDYGG